MKLREIALTPVLGAVNLAGGVLGEPLEGLLYRPEQAFERTPAPVAPDYGARRAWAAWPGDGSLAEAVPEGIAAQRQSAAADAFFVHPTTFLSGRAWNARFDEPGSSQRIVDLTLRNQASVFNGSCRIFAPRYRQASAIAFTARNGPDAGALDLAYSDVLRAFDYYLAHENNGRPFILAGHSQGSMHVLRLLQDRVIGTRHQSAMIAVYAIGAAVPEAIEGLGLPIFRDATQTGCVISWNCLGARSWRFAPSAFWLDRRYRTCPDHLLVCTNPLSWEAAGAMPASANLGALPGVSLVDRLPAPIVAVTGARCCDGRLIVRLRSQAQGFRDAATLLGNYHIYDYNLFYKNIRDNVDDRVRIFSAAPAT